jgi:hypothetical protein
MPAGIYNMLVEHGASYVLGLTWEDEDGNNPDLSTGYTASMIVSDSWGSTELLELTESSGLTLAASGSVTVTITPAKSLALPVGENVYHLEVIKTSTGKKDRLLKGKLTVEPKAGA